MVNSKTDLDGRPTNGLGAWRWRRGFLLVVNAFCMWAVWYCLWHNLESRVAETAVMMSFFTVMGSVGSYVFGATWDDRNRMQLLGTTPGEKIADRPLK